MAEVERIAEAAVAAARKHIPVEDAYIFGSYVEGSADDCSDIDLGIFSPAADTMDLETYLETRHQIRRAVEYEVDVHLYPIAALRSAHPTSFVGHILKTGKRLA